MYGEDGMAGEMFENVSLDLPKLDNKKMAEKYDMLHGLKDAAGRKKM